VAVAIFAALLIKKFPEVRRELRILRMVGMAWRSQGGHGDLAHRMSLTRERKRGNSGEE
jgi:hypothetical protein